MARLAKKTQTKPQPVARKLRAIYTKIDLQATGPMPEWDDVNELTPAQLAKRLAEGRYFYYYHHTIKELRPFVVEYYSKIWTKAQLRAFNRVKDCHVPVQLAAMCKMALDGAVWDEEGQAWCDRTVIGILTNGSKIKDVKVEEKKPVNIHDRVKDIRDEIMGDIDSFEDEFIKSGKVPAINLLMWLRQKTVPQQIIGDIEAYYKSRLEFINEARSSTDKDIKEGYRNFKKKDWDNWVKWYTSVLDDLSAYRRVKAETRKPRAKKPVPPERIVKGLKFLKDHKELGLVSIKPTEIVHAEQLWVFNVKTRKLFKYIASDMDKELTVKGSTILGFDPKKSVGKTLRKPKEQIEKFMKAGKIQLRTFMDEIKATEVMGTGRINTDTILLKVLK